MDNIIDQASKIAQDYAKQDNSLETVQRLVMRCQNPIENWQFVSTTKYAFPGKWSYVVLLYRDTGNITDDGMREIRMKCEMVITQEIDGGKLEYLLKAAFEE